MLSAHNSDRARDALYAIPPDCDRATWVKAGMAFHAAGGDFNTFNDWSASAPSYKAQDCRATWNSFKNTPGGITAGTLFGMARDHGWQDGNTKLRPSPVRIIKPAESPRKPAPGMSPDEVYNRCQAATHNHPYIMQKEAAGVPLDALRVVPDGDPLLQSGESWAGALVVPIVRPDGTFSGLLILPPKNVLHS